MYVPVHSHLDRWASTSSRNSLENFLPILTASPVTSCLMIAAVGDQQWPLAVHRLCTSLPYCAVPLSACTSPWGLCSYNRSEQLDEIDVGVVIGYVKLIITRLPADKRPGTQAKQVAHSRESHGLIQYDFTRPRGWSPWHSCSLRRQHYLAPSHSRIVLHTILSTREVLNHSADLAHFTNGLISGSTLCLFEPSLHPVIIYATLFLHRLLLQCLENLYLLRIERDHYSKSTNTHVWKMQMKTFVCSDFFPS